jgi:hypothetical protein
MPLRKLVLRIMLASLALAALAGVSAVFVAGRELVGRIVLTGISTAVACGLLLAASWLVDSDKSRPAGLLGMAAIIAEYLVALLLIWFESFNSSTSEPVWLTALAIFLTAPPTMLFLRLATPTRDPGALLGVFLSAACFAMMMIGNWFPFGSQYDATGHWWATSGITAGYGLLAVCCLAGIRTHRRPWRWIGILATLAACFITIVALWKDLHDGGGILTIIIGIAVVIAHANLALLVPLHGSQRHLRTATILAVLATTIFVDIDARNDNFEPDQPFARLAEASAILAGCGSLALLVVARINRKLPAPLATEIKSITLICPHCQKKHTVPLGDSSCPSCRLKFQIRVQEPRCPTCDYLLYGLPSDRCPECGTLINAPEPTPA